MPIKLIILDCDGVVLDSNMAYEKIIDKLLKKYGTHANMKEILHHFGEHPRKILQELFHHHDVDEVYREYVKIIKSKTFLKHIKIMPKAKLAIKKLKKKYRLVLASGALPIVLLPALRKFFMQKYFDYIITGEDVKHGKPNPEMIIKAMKLCRTKKNDTVYVGDAPNDAIAAKRANVRFVAVLTGVMNRKEARGMKSDFIIPGISGIDRIINEISLKKIW